jgi:dTDP-4-dehydrorhamnose 3,5-epimerase
MIFTETKLKGAFILDLDLRADDRGAFARTFCAQEFEAHGLKPSVAQCNLSYNYLAGTLRGMHYQVAPACETKLVRCTKGAIYDVIIDMRPDSPTGLKSFIKWGSFILLATSVDCATMTPLLGLSGQCPSP